MIGSWRQHQWLREPILQLAGIRGVYCPIASISLLAMQTEFVESVYGNYYERTAKKRWIYRTMDGKTPAKHWTKLKKLLSWLAKWNRIWVFRAFSYFYSRYKQSKSRVLKFPCDGSCLHGSERGIIGNLCWKLWKRLASAWARMTWINGKQNNT